MDQGFFQVSSFQPTIQSQRHMLPKRGPCLARHTSTSAGGSPAADSPPTRRRPASTAGPRSVNFSMQAVDVPLRFTPRRHGRRAAVLTTPVPKRYKMHKDIDSEIRGRCWWWCLLSRL